MCFKVMFEKLNDLGQILYGQIDGYGDNCYWQADYKWKR